MKHPAFLLCLSLAGLCLPAPAEESPAPLSLFDGKSLAQWKPLVFGGEGAVYVEEGELRLDQGSPMTGVVWQGKVPAVTNYEISLQAKKIRGNDFFLALTFPVQDTHCTFVVGGWGGGLVGISSINGMDASENETSTFGNFEDGKWYAIRLQVRPSRIVCFINDQSVVDVDIQGRRLGMRPGEIELCAPLGLATYDTWAAYRDISWRALTPELE